jgi:hypothetical protein
MHLPFSLTINSAKAFLVFADQLEPAPQQIAALLRQLARPGRKRRACAVDSALYLRRRHHGCLADDRTVGGIENLDHYLLLEVDVQKTED